MIINIVPLGNIQKKVIDEVSADLKNAFNAKIEVIDGVEFPKETFSFFRKQYDVEKVMDILAKKTRLSERKQPALFITQEDIFHDGLNFVFGFEDSKTNLSVISLARLKPEFYDKKMNMFLLSERACKEAIHEIGHYFGLGHCMRSFCVMSFSPSVKQVDEKRKELCTVCKLKLTMKERV